MAKRYIVTLSTDERETLRNPIDSGTHRARKITHARILLKADEGWVDREISRALEVGVSTIERVRQRFVNELKPWLKKEWCIPPEANAEFVYHVKDVLDVYTRPADPTQPIVCFDESPE